MTLDFEIVLVVAYAKLYNCLFMSPLAVSILEKTTSRQHTKKIVKQLSLAKTTTVTVDSQIT